MNYAMTCKHFSKKLSPRLAGVNRSLHQPNDNQYTKCYVKKPQLIHRGTYIAMLFTAIAIMMGIIIRPASMTNNRIGYAVIGDLSVAETTLDIMKLPFYEQVYALFEQSLFGRPLTIDAWDALICFIGVLVLLALGYHLSKYCSLTLLETLIWLAMCVLAGSYVFVLSKDFIQFLIFAVVALITILHIPKYAKLALVVLIFLFEFFVWRQYFCIVAVLLAGVYMVLTILKRDEKHMLRWSLTFIFVALISMLVFSYVLKTISHSSYSAIVNQHGDTRESLLIAIGANSTITSVIKVNAASPVYLFAANWLINTSRLLFPVELFQQGLKQTIFALYQVSLSFMILRRLLIYDSNDAQTKLCLAIYIAFLLASATFEPDFGSWLRHETAAVPILCLVVFGRCQLNSNHANTD